MLEKVLTQLSSLYQLAWSSSGHFVVWFNFVDAAETQKTDKSATNTRLRENTPL